MIVAKHFPGSVNPPFVSDMNVSSAHTGIVRTKMTVNDAYNTSGSLEGNLLADYHVIMYCPSLSILYGPGSSPNIPTSSKLGGYYHVCTNQTSTDIASLSHFISTTKGALAMSSMYGSQGDTIAQNAFIWASEIEFSLLGA